MASGFDLGRHAPVLLVIVVLLMASVYVSWSSAGSKGQVRSFSRVTMFGGTQIPGSGAFADVTRISPFGDDQEVSNCSSNVLSAGWVDVLDRDSANNPDLDIFNDVKALLGDMNSVSVAFKIDGQPVDVTATPPRRFESVIGSGFTCDELFSESGLNRTGDDSCWGRSFSTPLKLSPGSHEVYTEFFYDGEPLFDNTKTLDVVACNN